MQPDPIVSTEWLEAHLNDPDLRVIDCRGYVVTRAIGPGLDEADYRGAIQEYLSGHIPGAVYADWTSDIIDPNDPVPVQVAGPERFAVAMSVRGVGPSTRVVAVDHMGGQFATRLWWALRYHGHENASILEGGWNRWVEEERPIEAGPVDVARGNFVPSVRPSLRKTAEQVRDAIGDPSTQILDARDVGQFSGAKKRGPRGGHVPGAIHVPRERFMADGGGFLPLDEVRNRFESGGVDLARPIIAYCNGGVAATILLFNLHRLGVQGWSNYDGSWNEWGPRLDLPVEA